MKRRLGAMLAALAMFASIGASSVTASLAPTETTPGNYQCPAGSTKIEPVSSGTYALVGGGSITIWVSNTAKGPEFSFDADGATVGAVVVKGGPNYNTYIFSPKVDSASGLHSPLNLNNNKWYGLSHLCIEGTKKDDK